MKKGLLLLSCLPLGLLTYAQMVIQSGATVYLESGAKLTVQGDFTSSADVQGPGTIVMKGTSLQNIDMGGKTIPNLEIDNTSNVTLNNSSTRIGTNLLFTNGKLLCGSQNLIIGSTATITGNNTSKFVWTDGAGMLQKELTADVTNYEMPVGSNTSYRPAYITSTGGSYPQSSPFATFGVRNGSGASTNMPPSIANFISTYWAVAKTGISGGTQTIVGQYNDPTDISGTESLLKSYYFNGTDWTSNNGAYTIDAVNNKTTAVPITTASGEITAMNKFLAVGTRAFLQGAFNTSTNLMNDGLRTGTNVIPTADPYRASPYNASFSHSNNALNEVVSGTVFNDQTAITSDNNNIVDWVFLELRDNNSSPNNILQTRSALVQKDGDIVDVDGYSPVTFNSYTGKELSDGAYTIAVRHRNHLGLATNPTSPRTFTETKSLSFGANVADIRTMAASSLFGTSGTNYTTSNGFNLLWAGNVNANTASNYSGPSNDRAVMLTDLGGNQVSTLSGYQRADLNMNKTVNYSGPSNDRAFLLSNVLSGNQITSRSQVLPN